LDREIRLFVQGLLYTNPYRFTTILFTRNAFPVAVDRTIAALGRRLQIRFVKEVPLVRPRRLMVTLWSGARATAQYSCRSTRGTGGYSSKSRIPAIDHEAFRGVIGRRLAGEVDG